MMIGYQSVVPFIWIVGQFSGLLYAGKGTAQIRKAEDNEPRIRAKLILAIMVTRMCNRGCPENDYNTEGSFVKERLCIFDNFIAIGVGAPAGLNII